VHALIPPSRCDAQPKSRPFTLSPVVGALIDGQPRAFADFQAMLAISNLVEHRARKATQR
jgi:hypothetical protein